MHVCLRRTLSVVQYVTIWPCRSLEPPLQGLILKTFQGADSKGLSDFCRENMKRKKWRQAWMEGVVAAKHKKARRSLGAGVTGEGKDGGSKLR